MAQPNQGGRESYEVPFSLEEYRAVMGDGGPCMSCGGNDGYGEPPHHDPDCYFASAEDVANGS